MTVIKMNPAFQDQLDKQFWGKLTYQVTDMIEAIVVDPLNNIIWQNVRGHVEDQIWEDAIR